MRSFLDDQHSPVNVFSRDFPNIFSPYYFILRIEYMMSTNCLSALVDVISEGSGQRGYQVFGESVILGFLSAGGAPHPNVVQGSTVCIPGSSRCTFSCFGVKAENKDDF